MEVGCWPCNVCSAYRHSNGYHFDGLGSVCGPAHTSMRVYVFTRMYEYSVYGHVAASDPNHPNPFMFTGRQFDIETGLYYYRAMVRADDRQGRKLFSGCR